MLREAPNPIAAFQEVYEPQFDLVHAQAKLPLNPLTDDIDGKRPHSVSVEDVQFGDVGKGNTVITFIEAMKDLYPNKPIYTYRWNGSRNAGHAFTRDGVKISLHQLPVGSAMEGTINFLGRGMLIHTGDLVNEMEYLKEKRNGVIPGKIIIDGNALVGTDLQSAFEGFMVQKLGGGRGSTGSGVAQGYADWYLKNAIQMWQFKEKRWEDPFRVHYRFVAEKMGGESVLANIEVNGLTAKGEREKHKVGTEAEFIDRIRHARRKLLPYIDENVAVKVYDIWKNTDNPFIFEGAQGGGIDAYFGVYPDITSSRPIGRVGIPDSTEGFVHYKDIALPAVIMKIPYSTIVGSKIPPYDPLKQASVYREEQSERGETTRRNRDVYGEDMELAARLADITESEYLFLTHADAAHQEFPVELIIGYKDIITGEPKPYRPYQYAWDEVEPVTETVKSWDGKDAAAAQTMEELPEPLRRFVVFAEKATGRPLVGLTKGREKGDVIFNFDKNK